MKYIRYFLYGSLFALSLALVHAWQLDYISTQSAPSQTNHQNTAMPSASFNATEKRQISIPPNRLVHVKTDVLDLDIDTLGGAIVRAVLLKYPAYNHDKKEPFTLLGHQPNNFYVVKSGLATMNGAKQLLQYRVNQNAFALAENQSELTVNLVASAATGLQITKTFVFRPNRYMIEVHHHVINRAAQNWAGYNYLELSRAYKKPAKRNYLSLPSFFGVAISRPEKPYDKIALEKLREQPLNENIQNGWSAMIEHYFMSAWVPPRNQQYRYYSQVQQDIYTVGIATQPIMLSANQTFNWQAKCYIGPKIADRLNQIAPHLALTVDYSSYAIFSLLAVAIFWVLKHIYDIVGNWGWAIIIVTILIKLIFYHLSATSYRSMANMRKLQPKMTALKERLGDDKQAFQKEVMQLYKREKVNPLGGCLPILIQIPVFLALYWVLLESVELRQAPFMFWLQDLSARDPYYILPILMGLSMFVQQKLSPAPADPTQAKMMMFLPIVLTVFFLGFPSGLVLYWLVNNVLSILQQWYITRQVEAETYHPKRKKRRKRKK